MALTEIPLTLETTVDYSQPGSWNNFVDTHPWVYDNDAYDEHFADDSTTGLRDSSRSRFKVQTIGGQCLLKSFDQMFASHEAADDANERANHVSEMKEFIGDFALLLALEQSDDVATHDVLQSYLERFMGISPEKPTGIATVREVTEMLSRPEVRAEYLERMLGDERDNVMERWSPIGEPEHIWLVDQQMQLAEYPVARTITSVLTP
jgi:hypothetical protein